MRKYSTVGLALLMLLPAAAPAVAQNKEHVQMEAELRMVQEQNQQLSLAFQQAMEAIKALNSRFDQVNDTYRKDFADLVTRVNNIATEVSAMAERSRDTESRLRTLGDDIKTLQANVLALGTALTQGGAAPAAPLDSSSVPAGPAASPAAPVALPSSFGQSASAMLQQVRSDYYAGNFDLAIKDAQALIATPQFGDTEAAAEAQYWMGEAYYQSKKMPEAIAAYNVVLQKSPRATYAASAAYKRGEAQRAVGDMAAARTSWELTVRQYPGSYEAGLAQQRLTGLPAQNAPAKP